MKIFCLKNANLDGGKKGNYSILIENNLIAKISERNEDFQAAEIIELDNLNIFAGFIDIHNHGAVGVDVNTATAEDLRKVSRFLASKGVTAWLPTFVPDKTDGYRKVIDAIDEVFRTQENNERSEPAARVLGVHYEGVFANEKMCGALRPEFFKIFENGDEISRMPKLKTPDAIHLTTLAPEIENGIELVKELKKQNWIISIGHTNADSETLNRAFAAGATNVTHLFNAMTGLHHRDSGVAGWALTNDEISCEIIADGVHVAPPILKLAYKNKGAKNLALVSDSVAPTGLGDGDFELWNEKISVINGRTRNERGSIAGSVITILEAVKMMLSLGISIEEVSTMASFTPAKILGIEKDYGSIETGKRADLVAVDDEGNVKLTIIGGRVAYINL